MPPSARWILHVDLDAFFASVEELLRPRLRGLPLIVGGRPESRGVVAAASYAARAYGVRSAMPMAQALRLCPQAVVVPPRHGVYGQHSRRVMAILHEYTPSSSRSPSTRPSSTSPAPSACGARWRASRAPSSGASPTSAACRPPSGRPPPGWWPRSPATWASPAGWSSSRRG